LQAQGGKEPLSGQSNQCLDSAPIGRAGQEVARCRGRGIRLARLARRSEQRKLVNAMRIYRIA
jgi:hypothetical protein